MSKNETPLEQKLWETWLEHRNPSDANKLIKHYMYLVTFHVERVAANLPRTVQRDDLTSLALLGLFDALNKFELKRGLKFDTYASFRIRGAIIDGLRKEDWLPRSHRERTKQIEAVSEQLEQHLQRTPTSADIANELGITVTEVETLIRDSLFANVLSIEEKVQENSDSIQEGISYMIADKHNISPEEYIVNLELNEELVKSIKQLNENEQLVVSLFYEKELTMTEIGEVLQLTTSRISQIHKSALFKLRKILEKVQETQVTFNW